MIIKVYGMLDDYALKLGVRTNPENLDEEMHKKAKYWAPKKAKSYTIVDLVGVPSDMTFGVEYFTTKKEGKYQL